MFLFIPEVSFKLEENNFHSLKELIKLNCFLINFKQKKYS